MFLELAKMGFMETESKEKFQLKHEDLSHVAEDALDLWSDDCLQRKETAEDLESIVLSQKGPIVIALNGKWGSGKTFFLDRFSKQYKRGKRTSVFFDAWQDDTLEDPLLALIGQLALAFPSGERHEECKEILRCVFRFIKATAANFCKAQTGLDLEALLNPPETFFALYQRGLEERKTIRESLTKLAQKNFEETGAPLLFVIDELDRCRPTFAVSLLERVKHLFSIPHVVFVIGADLEQLKHTIRSVYGDIDASNYLHRFLDIELALPEASPEKFVQMLCQKHQFANHKLGDRSYDFMWLVANQHHLSLREIEKSCRLSAFVSFSQNANGIDAPIFVVPAVVLKVRDEVRYRKFVEWNMAPRELVDLVFPGLTYDQLQYDSRIQNNLMWLLRIYASDAKSRYLNEIDEILSQNAQGHPIDKQSNAIPAFLASETDSTVAEFLESVQNQVKNFGQTINVRYTLQRISERLDFIGPENF